MEHVAALLAGGSGTRFWPLSRRARPKQLLPLAPGGRTLLRATFDRIAPLYPPGRVIVVTGAHLAEAIRAELPELAPEQVFAEPEAKNTAPAVGLAVAWAAQRFGAESVTTILPADHYIADEDAFRAAVARARAHAAVGPMTLLGVRPTRPDTGFGYFEVHSAGGADAAGRIVRFVEKPDAERARAYVDAGCFLWNSGSFFLRCDTALAAFDAHVPALGAALRRYVSADATMDDVYRASPATSIDYAVMEHERGLDAFALDAGWNDIGSWEALGAVHAADPLENAGPPGATLAIDARRNLVHAQSGKLVALLGVDDLVVVDTEDALLVCPRDRAQDVRRLVDELGKRGRRDLL
jgi:mannose-1-phosphate guanylyltransferase